jgi:hypothetical protein
VPERLERFLQYERLCYNDIQPLYAGRGIDADTFPYVNGSLQDGRLVGEAIEYPVLTRVFMGVTGLLVGDVDRYLLVSAVLPARSRCWSRTCWRGSAGGARCGQRRRPSCSTPSTTGTCWWLRPPPPNSLCGRVAGPSPPQRSSVSEAR